MGTIACIVGLVIACVYVTIAAKKEQAKGNGYVVSGTDLAEETGEKSLPPFWSSILPLVVVILMMFFLKREDGNHRLHQHLSAGRSGSRYCI